MKGSPDRIQACTTTHFDGSIAVVDPEKSWVARWQRTSASSFLFFWVCDFRWVDFSDVARRG